MSFLKRAILHSTRKVGKSILMFMVLTIIAILVLTCLSIQSATKLAQINVRESLGGSYTINAKSMDNQLTDEILEQIALIDGVSKIDNAHSESYAEYNSINQEPLEVKKDITVVEEPLGFGHAGKLQSNLYSDKDELFTNEGFELLSGRHITKGDTNVALIHEDFASRNNLSVGDKFVVDLNSYMVGQEDYISNPVEVEIIGIFTNTKEQDMALNVTYTLYQNVVFTDPTTYTQLFDNGSKVYYDTAEVIVNDPAKLDEIITEMKTIDGVDWDSCNITYHDTEYQNAKTSLESLENLVSISIIIISVISIAVLALILTLWVRYRIHETGILISVGISKFNILLQHMTEILMIAVIAFVLSFAISSVVSQQVGNTLLGQTATTTSEESTQEVVKEDATNDLTNLEVSVSTTNLMVLYLLGTAIILLSVTIASIPIMKIKPKEILSTMS